MGHGREGSDLLQMEKEKQTLLRQPLAVSSACHCKDVMVGPCSGVLPYLCSL